MANTKLATVDKLELSVSDAQSLVASIQDGLKVVNKGYLAIAPDVSKLYDAKAFKTLGFKNFDEMCDNLFEMSHGTTVGIRKVFDKFGSKNAKTGNYSIPDRYNEYGYTKLLLFTDKRFEEVGINPIETFSANMTIAEMKSVLTNALEAKAEKQDNEAIDTTATDVTESDNVSRETSDSDNVSIDASSDKELLTDIMNIAKELKERMNYIGGEKSCLLDAIIANAKELKKVAK